MTLKTRNRLFFIFFIVSLIAFFTSILIYIYAGVKGKLVPLNGQLRPFAFYDKSRLFNYSFSASIISIVFFLVYSSAVSFVLYSGFEKTQSTEIIYFFCFLIACSLEGLRILFPINGLWKTYSVSVYLIGRCVFAGRIMAPLSLLFASLFNDAERRQDIERNMIVLAVVSIVFAAFIPINAILFFTTCTVVWEYGSLFNAIRIVFFLLTLVTTIINAFKKSSNELYENAIGFTVLMAGYSLLLASDNYFILFIAIALFGTGTVFYLKSIHRLYMWR